MIDNIKKVNFQKFCYHHHNQYSSKEYLQLIERLMKVSIQEFNSLDNRIEYFST
nr:hypothetical protein [Mycoplasmopsis bovis]